jgi:hypothetical protein
MTINDIASDGNFSDTEIFDSSTYDVTNDTVQIIEHWFRQPTAGSSKMEYFVGDKKYIRHAIKTHYIQAGKDNYIDIINQYVVPLYKPGDIVSISEKIISICQNRIVYKKDIKVSRLAYFLSKYVHQTSAGEAVGNPYKMQLAINAAGVFRVIMAAFVAAITRPFGIRGLFYKIAGRNVASIDGFETDGFIDYLDMCILPPEEPNKVCNDIREKAGIKCMIVDANDLGVEILGACDDIGYNKQQLIKLIIDNPACQEDQKTPLVLIREI